MWIYRQKILYFSCLIDENRDELIYVPKTQLTNLSLAKKKLISESHVEITRWMCKKSENVCIKVS